MSTCSSYLPQGLLRELYKIQGHSYSGATEWDWSKFEAQPGSIQGDVTINTACGETSTPVKAGETPQVPGLWQALPVEAKAAIKANVRRVDINERNRVGQLLEDNCNILRC